MSAKWLMVAFLATCMGEENYSFSPLCANKTCRCLALIEQLQNIMLSNVPSENICHKNTAKKCLYQVDEHTEIGSVCMAQTFHGLK